MSSYLQNRQTATTIGNIVSNFREVNVGVAQGSKLGPLHFIVYINDLLRCSFIGRLLLYADDAVLTYACDTYEELQQAMQHDVLLLNRWLCSNVFTLNSTKTPYMTFGRARNIPDLNIVINGVTIKGI